MIHDRLCRFEKSDYLVRKSQTGKKKGTEDLRGKKNRDYDPSRGG